MKFIVVVAVLLIALAATNPSRSDYLAYEKGQVTEQTGGVIGFFVNPFIDSVTVSKNLGLGSIYTTQIDETRKTTTLGIFNQFIPLD